ncbi:DUF2125 domain-containing protein [Parvibaculum sp.]|uniref:DUF2125 domain-containing protein n=1 Tax=Parvibaculum sp. TaxID=2024848 RepID=UPI00320F78A7
MTSTPSEAPLRKPATRARIFLPAIALAVLAAIYSIYWYVMAGKARDFLESFAAQHQSGDVAVNWSGLAISGYPYRVEANFTAPAVSAPNAPEAWRWSADSLAADFLPYSLNHVVLKVGGEQLLQYRDPARNGGKRHAVRISAEGTWASYVNVKDAPFGRLAIDINNLVALKDGKAPSAGQRFAAGRLQFHTRPADAAGGPPTADVSYDVAIQGDNMALDDSDAPRVLGPRIDVIAAQARIRNLPRNTNASPVDFGRAWAQGGGVLTISDMQVKWGPLDLWAQGELSLDAQARPQGRLEASVADYAGLLKALVKGKVISAKDERIATVGLGIVAELQGDQAGRVRVPVTITEGKIFLGPVLVARLEPLF